MSTDHATPPPVSEAAFQRQVLDLARLLGWRVAHFRPARTARGWRTPVQGDGKGFLDVLFVRGERLIVAELKSDTGKLSDDQAAWLDALRGAGVAVQVWRPADWPRIEAVLAGRGA